MSEADCRNAIRGILSQHDAGVEEAMRRELAKPFDLGHSGRLQFEVDPFGYGVHLVQTEEGIFDGSALELPDALMEETDENDPYVILGEELFPWLADRWQAVGGPRRFSPAYAYHHGGLDEPRYHLEQRRWCEVEEVWPGEG